jgi:3'(2'), 5'-bisphosphate nucleotidase
MQLDEQHADAVALRLARIALEAGRLLQRMEQAITGHRVKPDGTPTTGADLAAENLIIERLKEAWPDIPVVAEETANAASPDHCFFLVDPLDGTSDFIRGTGEYTVNIAAINGRRPVASVVSAPAVGRIWIAGQSAKAGRIAGDDVDGIAWEHARVRPAPERDLIALVSRRHGDDATETCLSSLAIGTRRTASSALKFCLIASGEADIYVRCGPTMEWDTAAGDHILSRAGGAVIGAGGGSLTYGREHDGYKNGPFAALGDPGLARRLSLPLATAS